MQLIVLIRIFDIERIRERVSEEVACRRLERLPVMHQRFDRISILRSRELLALSLPSGNDRDRQVFLNKTLVHFPHHLCALFRLFISSVDRMPLLPQELPGTQERSCRLLPAEHGTPLVPYLRQVAVGLHGLAPHIAEQRLRCGPDAESLLELLHTAVCHPRHFRRKALDMILLLLEQALRDQHRKIHILHTCIFKTLIQVRLDILPQRIAVGQVVQTSLYP